MTFPPASSGSIAPGEPNPGAPLGHDDVLPTKPTEIDPPESIAPGEPNPGTPLGHEDALPTNPTEIDVDCQPRPKVDEVDEQCILSFAPVVCNGVCVFHNGCLAGQAGFVDSDCELLEEPPDNGMGRPPSTIAIGELYPAPPILIGEPVEKPDTGTGPSTIAIGEPYNGSRPCSLAFVSVVCGDLYKFENLCLAKAAGYAEEECTPNPVDVSVSQPNDTEEAIVVEAPGMAIPGETAVSIITETEEATSAYPDIPAMIILGKPPVSVLIVTEETASGTNNASWCPETGSDVVCNERFDPVLCGPEKCAYGNLCLGIGADFLETDCGSAR
jgi:hypothetical protein